ncbi:PilW family protein [Teredinibacter turnerae]|uniref:PilW family protein n=1 Tax=Teredinibacter turnerae TaxID=2426 RepID=UPI0005F78451|nr:hypothetical protein [Teredinibacter turnerae]
MSTGNRGRSRQAGATLISQMVGMLISMLALLACVALHKNLMQVSVQAKTDALLDRQIASALLQMQYELHNAGLGLPTASASDVVVAESGSVSSLYWRYVDGGVYRCRGFREDSYIEADTNITGRRLVELVAPNNCDALVDLTGLAWQAQTILGEFRNQQAALLRFSVAQASCTPYGLGVATDHFQVRVRAASSAGLAGGAVTPTEYSYCLTNTHLNT